MSIAAWGQTATNRWEKDIAAFEASDRTNPPPQGAIVFVGSSSIRLWRSLARDFPGLPVVNRGFGGSEMADSAHFAERIVLPLRPRQVVVYAGDNDLANRRSPQRVLDEFKVLVGKIHQALPETRVTFIAIKPSPARWALADQARAANRLVADYCKTDQRLSYADIFTPMLGDDGRPRDALFVQDRLHLSAKGYDLWTTVVRPLLK